MDIVVLVSGHGSNLRAVAAAIEAGTCDARIRAVISDRTNAPALEFAAERGVETLTLPLREGDDREAWNQELANAIAAFDPALVVFAGFMRVVGSPVVQRFPGRIINVHPALAPAFPGVDAPAQAIEARVRISGCTVHVVDEGVDTGPILAQAAVPVFPDDDRDSLHQRIQAQEHHLLPRVIQWIASGKLELDPSPRFTEPLVGAADRLVSPRVTGDPE